MSSHASLDAAAQERKARLAKLKTLKRKQPDTEEDGDAAAPQQAEQDAGTTGYLSGRNYDVTTRGPKLGFEENPSKDQDTAELRARELANEAKAQEAKEAQENKPLDLFKLQPKKPNWDLKRDLDKKMEILNVRTDNAIARLVKDRIASQKHSAGDETGGLQGEELVSTLHAREQQEADEERREKLQDSETEEGFT